MNLKHFDIGKVKFSDEELEAPYKRTRYNLYFQLNGKDPELQGKFDTKQEALDAIRKLIEEKSSITYTETWRFWKKDGVTYIDYGAHNAFYMIKEVEC